MPDELLHVAEAAADFMSGRGFTVRLEREELGFPFCPTLLCRRGHITHVVEVAAALDQDKLRSWVGYGKSCGKEFRMAYAVPVEARLQADSRDLLAEHGLGLLEVDNAACEERVVAQDLSLSVELPPLRSMSRQIRALLGRAYEHFEQGNWRESFEDAAQALEAQARRYLKRHASRIVYIGKQVTPREIDRMPLGGLAKTFQRIQNQNLDDKQIGATLQAINRDRIGVVHHRGHRRAESRLRANVGKHMWAICGAMKHVIK